MTDKDPDVPNPLQWLGGWPEDPNAPMPEPLDFRRFHMMDAAKNYLASLGVFETAVSEEIHPGYVLEVMIRVRPTPNEGASRGQKGKAT